MEFLDVSWRTSDLPVLHLGFTCRNHKSLGERRLDLMIVISKLLEVIMTALLLCKLAMPGVNWTWQECLPFAKFPEQQSPKCLQVELCVQIHSTNNLQSDVLLHILIKQSLDSSISTYPHSKSCKFHLSAFQLAGLAGNTSTPKPNNQFLPCLSMFRKGCWRSSPSTTRAAPVWCLNSKMDPASPRFNDLQTTSSDFMIVFFDPGKQHPGKRWFPFHVLCL